MGALVPLGKVAGRKGEWLRNVTAYSLSGALTSALVGSALGWLGSLVLSPGMRLFGWAAAVAVSLLVVAREMEWVSFRRPQLRRQTRRTWSIRFPGPVAIILWGLDVGLVFTTWLTFLGVWLVVALAIVERSALVGAGLFTAYWAGRAVAVWVLPSFVRDAQSTTVLLQAIVAERRVFQRLHVLGAAWLAGLIVARVLEGWAL